MGTRTRLNLALLVLLGVLVMLAVYEPGKTPPPAPHLLTTLDPATVDSIRISPRQGPVIDLSRQHGRWLLIAPLHISADAGRINALLRLLTTPVHEQFPLNRHKLAAYGLTPPFATVQFNHTTLTFGGDEPISHQRYVRQGNTVSLITDSMSYYLLARPDAFIDLALLTPQADPVAFDLPGLRLRQVHGRWQATPAGALHSADEVTTLVNAWRHSQALEVRPYTPGAQITQQISITLAGVSQPLRFDIVHSADGVLFGRRDLGLAWLFPKAAVRQLLQLRTPVTTTTPARRS